MSTFLLTLGPRVATVIVVTLIGKDFDELLLSLLWIPEAEQTFLFQHEFLVLSTRS